MESDNKLEHINYEIFWTKKKKLTFLFLVCFFGSFLFYFPFINTIGNVVKSQVQAIPNCPIDIGSFDVEYFLPKIVLKNTKIPARCLEANNDLIIPEAKLYFRGPSFSPLGLSFKLETLLFNNKFEVYLGAGINDFAINIKNNQINLDVLEIPNLPVSMQGKMNINLIARTDLIKLSDIKLNISSLDLTLPPQNIQGFNLPLLKIAPLNIQGELDQKGSSFTIGKCQLGEAGSDIRALFNGNILINQNNIAESNLNLKGEFNFSDSFLNNFAILKMFLGGYTLKDDFYQIKVFGPLSFPQIAPN